MTWKAIAAIYNYVIGNIQYDFDKAASVQSGYLPDIDKTLNTKKRGSALTTPH